MIWAKRARRRSVRSRVVLLGTVPTMVCLFSILHRSDSRVCSFRLFFGVLVWAATLAVENQSVATLHMFHTLTSKSVAYKIAGPKSRIFILYILATVLPLGIAPFTFTAMASTNNALLAKADKYATTPVWEKAVPGAEEGDEGVEALVQKWKGLNLIRSLMPSAAAVLGAVAIFGGL